LSQARNRAAEIRADPVVLVTTLETLSELVVSNPAATERVLVYLADYLRASLDVEGEFGNHEARDGALVRLRAELHDSGLHQAHVA
jgi:LytS/YehU family sensor histidine kinase